MITLTETTADFALLAQAKVKLLQNNPLGFFIASMMAGAYVGMGIILIFSVGEHADPSVRNLIMGASFGVALTLVMFAGAELFTGYTMYMTLGLLTGVTSAGDLGRSWMTTWCGNLAGCLVLAWLFYMGGGGGILKEGADLLHAFAIKKMNSPASELVVRGILCNWLVCLAIWGSTRTNNDVAKCILMFWCLFVFIAAGFEHSIANMTIFSIALLSDHPDTITFAGAAHNLLWVTIGNAISGAGFMGLCYWLVSGSPTLVPECNKSLGKCADRKELSLKSSCRALAGKQLATPIETTQWKQKP